MPAFRHIVVSCATVLTLHCPVYAAPLNQIAAVINGEMVTSFDVHQQAIPEILRLGLDTTNPSHDGTIAAVHRQILDSMVSDILVSQEATKLGIVASPEEIENEYRKIVERSGLSQEDFEKQLKQQSLTADDLRNRVQSNILRHRLLNHMVTRKVVIDPDAIAAYYEEHKDQFLTDRSVHIGLVIFPPTADVDALIKEAKAGHFVEVAAKNSIGPNPQNGGDIGTVAWGDLTMQWRAVLANMKTGDVSDPITVEGRQAILHLIEDIAGKNQDLSEVSPQIENILREPKLQERFKEYMEQLRSRAVIDIRTK